MEMAQILGLWVHWQHQVCRDSNCLSYKSYGTISVFLASGSWPSEGLFGWSFSVAWNIRHFSFFLARQMLKGPPSLGSFICPVLMCVEREAIELAPPPVCNSAVSPCLHVCLAFFHKHFSS